MAKKFSGGRISGGFLAFPWSVLDSTAWYDLSHVARSLLVDMARQYRGTNNGQLLLSRAHLSKRGWNSSDTITRAKRELLASGLIFETVKGHNPNKASWYALSWRDLDRHPGYDDGAFEAFKRGAYRVGPVLPLIPAKPTKEHLYERWRSAGTVESLFRETVQTVH